jgi:hypothetical protein
LVGEVRREEGGGRGEETERRRRGEERERRGRGGRGEEGVGEEGVGEGPWVLTARMEMGHPMGEHRHYRQRRSQCETQLGADGGL